MLKPEYLQSVPDNMIKLFAQAEADILADMARRISEYDYWIPAAEHQAKMLEEAGMVREEILARLNRLTGKTTKELTELMVEVGTVALKSDDEVYQRSGLDPPPISSSRDLQAVLQAGYEKTAGQFLNLTKTTANTATFQFERALDRAYMQITMGGFDYNTAIRNTIKDLSKDGVGAIRYPSGKVDSIEVAVRRAVVTGVNQTSLRLQDTRADEMGADLVEVNAHSGARPEHAVWQGGIYSRSGKSTKYPGLVETTGYGTGAGLGGWNCSHSYRPWFEGMPRTYSEDMLEEYNAKNIEYDGKKLTEYEALQEQRYIERNIRRWKREEAAMSAAGLDASEATAKVREWNRKHKDFLEQTGLKADGTRTVVGKRPIERNAITGIDTPVISSKESQYQEYLRGLKKGTINLRRRHKDIITQIPTRGDYAYFRKHQIQIEDLAPLTAATGDEFAIFDAGNNKILAIHGGTKWNIPKEAWNEIEENQMPWVAHSHDITSRPLPSSEDRYTLRNYFTWQDSSAIINIRGEIEPFTKEEADWFDAVLGVK